MLSSPKAQATLFAKDIPRSVSYLSTPGKKEGGKRAHEELEEDSEASESGPFGDENTSVRQEGEKPRQADSNAALMLLQLRSRGTTTDATCEDEHREKRQRRRSVPSQIP